MDAKEFRKEIWDYYKKNKRSLPWRNNQNNYHVFVSEIMLQQTQVSRVLKIYPLFIQSFPDFQSLSNAPLSSVLKAWSGMGYNRRAKFLKQSADIIIRMHHGKVPDTFSELLKLPGVGPGTAGSLLAFVHNKPSVFVETNIRRVIIHFFFSRKKKVNERDIIRCIEQTVDRKKPREWYYALMDYGAMLPKREKHNANTKSILYKKQKSFSGSKRELRGMILRLLSKKDKASKKMLIDFSQRSRYEVESVLYDLCKEGLIRDSEGVYIISDVE